MNIRYHFKSKVLIASTNLGICAILYGDSPIQTLRETFPNAIIEDSLEEIVFTRVLSMLQKILYGEISALDIFFDIQCGTEFQRKVWSEIRKIPLGTTISYSELATRIGQPKAVRAVASACGKNPISVAIPCHRVLPKDGSVGKYRWGTKMKKTLLWMEGAIER